MTVQELKQKMDTKEDFTLLDVRKDRELIMASIDGSKHMPMMAIPYQMNEINKDNPVYILWHSGVRSAQACLYLEQQGFDATNIIGGILAWATEVYPSVPID